MSEPAERITATGNSDTLSPYAQFSGVQQRAGGIEATQQGRRKSQPAKTAEDSLTLSPEAQEQLRKLQQRDAEVRAHEAAHLAAAGQYAAGGAHYEYQQGPDGRQYAIGGHVDIDTSSVPGDPEATERKAEQIRRAAKAPGAPSAQDNKVAASAAHMEAQAKIQQQKEDSENSQNKTRGLQAYATAMQQGADDGAATQRGSLFGMAV